MARAHSLGRRARAKAAARRRGERCCACVVLGVAELRRRLSARRGGAEPALRPDGAVRALHGAALRRQHHALPDRPRLAPRPAAGARPARPGAPRGRRGRALLGAADAACLRGARAPGPRRLGRWLYPTLSQSRLNLFADAAAGLRAGGHTLPYPQAAAGGRAQVARGRMREFFQCDLDIAGAYPGMAADAEVVSVRTHAPPPQAAARHSPIPPRCLWSLLSDGGSPCGVNSARMAPALSPAPFRDRSCRRPESGGRRAWQAETRGRSCWIC